MSARGVHFAITTVETRPLLDAEDDDALVEAVEAIEERWDEAHLCETDKAWDAIHRTLTDGTLLTEAGGETDPLSLAVFGGRTLNEGDEHWVVLVDAKDVRRVATALGKMRQADFRARYFGKKFPDYDGQQGEEDFAYTWANFQDLAKFYAKAAKDRRHVVFSVSKLPRGDATAPRPRGRSVSVAPTPQRRGTRTARAPTPTPTPGRSSVRTSVARTRGRPRSPPR